MVFAAETPAVTPSRSYTIKAMAKVLIVEDDDVIAQGMARHLEAAGFDPLWVSRGEAGLASSGRTSACST